MLTVLLILFLVSLTGIGIILVRHRKNEHNNLLHYMKKSCNIDSIAFEKKLQKTTKTVKKLIYISAKSSQKIVKNLHNSTRYIVNSSKKIIRNKLFDTKQNSNVSDFIANLKDDSKE